MDINEVLQKVYETLPPQPSLKFKITKTMKEVLFNLVFFKLKT